MVMLIDEIQNIDKILLIQKIMNELDTSESFEKLKKQLRQSQNSKQNGSIVIPSLISLTLSACGGGGGGGSVVTPSPANRSPVAAADSTLILDEDADATELNISAPTDQDTGDTLTITVDSVPTGGEIRTASGELVTEGMSLTINELTGLTFTPNENVNSDINTVGSFSYTVSDQAGGEILLLSLLQSTQYKILQQSLPSWILR